MKASSGQRATIKVLGTLGYFSVIFQWAWSVLIVAYPLLNSDFFVSEPVVVQPAPTTSPESGIGSTLMTVLAVLVTIVVLVMTIMALAKLPRQIGKGGARLTHAAAAKTTALVLPKHQSVSQKERRRLSYRFTLLFKLLAVVLPLALLIFADTSILTLEIIWTIGIFCASVSFALFALQQLIAAQFRVKSDQIW